MGGGCWSGIGADEGYNTRIMVIDEVIKVILDVVGLSRGLILDWLFYFWITDQFWRNKKFGWQHWSRAISGWTQIFPTIN